MKRMITAVLTLALLVTLAACGTQLSGTNDDPNQIVIGGCQALDGMGGFAGCVIPVSSRENDLSATQSNAILDMIASIAPMN